MTVSEIRQFPCLVTAGTPKATPLTFSLAFPTRQVDWIELEVPDGPGGNVGFYLSMGAQQIIPFQTGTWIVTSGTLRHWDMAGLPTSGAWNLVAYNTGANAHTLYVYFGLEMTTPPTDSAVTFILPTDALTSS